MAGAVAYRGHGVVTRDVASRKKADHAPCQLDFDVLVQGIVVLAGLHPARACVRVRVYGQRIDVYPTGAKANKEAKKRGFERNRNRNKNKKGRDARQSAFAFFLCPFLSLSLSLLT